MEPFSRRGGRLHAESVPLERLAQDAGTPLYVYAANELRRRYRAVGAAFSDFDPLVCYSVKSNSNLGVLALLAAEGAWFDIVSGGELHRVARAGGDLSRVVFAGVGKTDPELREALARGVHAFNVESEGELGRLDALARAAGKRPRVALRVNPDVAAATHAYVATGHARAKFGMPPERARALLAEPSRWEGIEFHGLHVHIGSRIRDVTPFVRALAVLEGLANAFPGGRLPSADLGGGFAIDEEEGPGLDLRALADALRPGLRRLGARLALEPGRWISGPSGLLLARVLDVKTAGGRALAVVDAGMNDLLRPALYDARHRIVPVVEPEGRRVRTDVVGPVCESGDFLGLDRELPPLAPGDLLAVLDAGAYGFSMSSQYNGRPRAAEVLVDGETWRTVRRRESVEDLCRGEDPGGA
ncbi:MAG TPA: diaminopimelate decarboxylase [Planctomycetota bacterium]|jgi:diaminopimelate decarboxylase|nr:diaminopimelate decarboxylase [Planctomycetota bacterium]